jgi:hypothetical protein
LARSKWYQFLKSGNVIGDPQSFCDLMHQLRNYTFTWKLGFIDFSEWFLGSFNDFPNISSVHLLHLTQDGILSKTDDLSINYSTWRDDLTIEPFKCFRGPLVGDAPIMKQPVITKELKGLILQHKKIPNESRSFWENLLSGGIGSIQPQIRNPISFCFNPVIGNLPRQQILEVERSDPIQKFGQLEWNDELNCFTLEAYFENTIEKMVWSDLVDKDGTHNVYFENKYRYVHPNNYAKFKANIKPKDEQFHVGRKKTAGAILANDERKLKKGKRG